MDLGVSLPLVAARKLASAEVAGKRLLPGVRADVRGEVVAAAEVAHADAALEGLVARVDADVSGQLVGAREAAVAALGGARVRPLVDGCLAGSVRVLSGPQDGPERQVLWAVRGRESRGPSLGTASTRRAPQRIVPDGVQWGQRRGHAERVERARAERLPLREGGRLHLPLARRRWEEGGVVGHDAGEQAWRVGAGDGGLRGRVGRRRVRGGDVTGGGGQERRGVLVVLPPAAGGVGGRRGVQVVVVVVVVVHVALALSRRHGAAQRTAGVVVRGAGGGWRGGDRGGGGRRGRRRRRRRHAEDARRDDVDDPLRVPVAGVLGGVD